MSLPRDLRSLKQNGSATAAEMAEFLGQLRGKRPQEVLGVVAQSGLAHGIVASTLFVAALVGVLTVGPFVWARVSPPPAKAAAKKETPAQPAVEAATTASEPAKPADAAQAAIEGGTPGKPNVDILEKLGQSESKEADPKKNPLEDKTDDLLKDLK
jgi:hypothetical protein